MGVVFVGEPEVLIPGFPGTSPRGYLGWSTVVLLRFRGAVILFDTGGPGDRPRLLRELERRGIGTGDVSAIVLSHLHFDHALNVEMFENAEVFVHAEELSYAERSSGTDLAICGWAVNEIRAHPHLRVIEGEAVLFDFVNVILTPGHTDGCVSMVLNVQETTWVLAQDAIKTRREILDFEGVTAMNPDKAQNSVRRIVDIANVIVPGHDVPLRMTGGTPVPLESASLNVSETIAGRQVTLELPAAGQ